MNFLEQNLNECICDVLVNPGILSRVYQTRVKWGHSR